MYNFLFGSLLVWCTFVGIWSEVKFRVFVSGISHTSCLLYLISCAMHNDAFWQDFVRWHFLNHHTESVAKSWICFVTKPKFIHRRTYIYFSCDSEKETIFLRVRWVFSGWGFVKMQLSAVPASIASFIHPFWWYT